MTKVFLIIVLAALLLTAGNAESAESEQPQPTAESTQPASPGPNTELSNSLGAYDSEIAQIQAEGGALDARLSEPLTSAGIVQMATGDHAGAAKSFDRALFITRVNLGLYSLTQVPLIEMQIENNTAWDQATALDRNYQNLYWVFRRNYGQYDLALVPFIERIAIRRLNTFNAAPRASTVGHAVHADQLYDHAIAILGKHPEQRSALIQALYHRALANYDVAITADDTSESLYDLRKAMAEGGIGPYDIDDFEARGEMFRDFYLKGTVALDRLIELTAADPKDYFANAQALVFAGDYEYAFRRDWDATDYYDQAWKVLQKNGATPAEIEELFGTPHRLEPIAIPGEETPLPNEHRYWVDATFDLSDKGWPENIRIIATHPENDADLVSSGEYAVAGVRHRPRFENGKPVASSNVSLRYVFKKY